MICNAKSVETRPMLQLQQVETSPMLVSAVNEYHILSSPAFIPAANIAIMDNFSTSDIDENNRNIKIVKLGEESAIIFNTVISFKHEKSIINTKSKKGRKQLLERLWCGWFNKDTTCIWRS